jgi:DNA-binding response OmpR family regulator
MNDTKKILIVDDNKDLADGVAMVLDMDGYDADVVYSGKKAVSKLIDGHYDMALVDIKMPDISGLQIFNECRNTVKTEFIFMTGFRIEQIVSEIYKQYDVCIIRADTLDPEVLSEVFDGGKFNVKIVIGNADLTNDRIIDYCNDADIRMTSIYSDDITEVSNDCDYIVVNLNEPLINSVILMDKITNTIRNGVNIVIIINNTNNEFENIPINSFSMAGCLFKPINPEVILSVVRNTLELHEKPNSGAY